MKSFIRKNNKLKFDKHDYYPAQGMKKRSLVLEDNGIVSGVDLVAQTVQLFEEYDFDCEVLAASLRNTRQVREVMLAGANVATLPFSVIEQLTAHAKTLEGMQKFTEDVVPEYKMLLRGR